MNTTENSVEIRVLGQFSILQAGKPLARALPEPEIRDLLCNLLSPQGDSIARDRLCRSLWQVPLPTRAKPRLAELVRKLNTYFMMECGIMPVMEKDGGLSYHDGLIRLDARLFYQTSLEGLRLLAAGNSSAAAGYFKAALSLYHGPFLPGCESRIIFLNRDCLHSLYLAMRRHVSKLQTGDAGIRNLRHPRSLAA